MITSITVMRFWSLHPSLLDRLGLVALWRKDCLPRKYSRDKRKATGFTLNSNASGGPCESGCRRGSVSAGRCR